MRGLRGRILVQVLLWWGCLGALHALRRIGAYYYHRGLEGMALPTPTLRFGVPVLGGGFHCPQPHTVLFYLFWGALFLAPLALALWAGREGDPAEALRRWSGSLTTFLLGALLALLIWAWSLALPLLPLGSSPG